jgi:hypothetical protein
MTNNAVEPNHSNSTSPYSTVADPAWVAAAKCAGYGGDSLTREACIDIANKSGLRLPRWLMKDPLRRLGRGKYAIPELNGVKNETP